MVNLILAQTKIFKRKAMVWKNKRLITALVTYTFCPSIINTFLFLVICIANTKRKRHTRQIMFDIFAFKFTPICLHTSTVRRVLNQSKWFMLSIIVRLRIWRWQPANHAAGKSVSDVTAIWLTALTGRWNTWNIIIIYTSTQNTFTGDYVKLLLTWFERSKFQQTWRLVER